MSKQYTYKQGDILRPTEAHTGYCQIWSVQVIPEGRLDYYSEDGSIKSLYHVYTDFGNTLVLTEEEITSGYEVVGNECVSERVARWQDGVMRVAGMIDKESEVKFNDYSFYLEDYDQSMLDYIEDNLEFWEVGCMLFSTGYKYLKYDHNSNEFYTADYKTSRDQLWSKDMFWGSIHEQQETL